jgi:ABC-type sugar transport system substrate-binding protein
MAAIKRVALFLTHDDDAQRAWAATVREACRTAGFELEQHWSEDPTAQNHLIGESIFKGAADALLILPATASGPAALLSQAAARGQAIVLLDRVTHDLSPDVSWSLPRLRRERPDLLAVRVAPDEEEIGRIQGRQILALLPVGGSALYVQGDARTPAASGRTAGLEEVLASRPGYEIRKVDGGWSSARAETAVVEWLKLVLRDPRYRLELVVAQSEVMLEGIRRGLERIARESSRPELLSLPMTACDGLPDFKRAVDEGRLAATVEIPSRTAAAMHILIDYASRGALPASCEIALPPSSYPSLDRLGRPARL